MDSKQKLRDMLDSLINQNTEKAEVDFHGYLPNKVKELFGKDEPIDDEEPSSDTN